MFKTLSARLHQNDIDPRLLIPLLGNTMAVQVAILVVRVTASYRVVELGLPPIWLGVISCSFALVPIGLAVWVGRFNDRGNDARANWIGSGLQIIACIGFAIWPSAIALLGFMTLLGIGHLFVIASQQMLCVRCGGSRGLESVFGSYMVVSAIGQGIGPLIVGWAGGNASTPPTGLLFVIGVAIAFIALAFSLAIRPGDRREVKPGDDTVPIASLLRVPGLVAVILTSVMISSASDLVVVYLPLLGAERSIDVAAIGLLLTVRSVASMVARVLYSRIIRRIVRKRLMVVSVFAGAIAFFSIALPLPLLLMHVAMAVIGFSLGLAMTVSLTSVVDLTREGMRGIANSLRLLGNRVGQFAFPLGAGLLATATGAGSIFILIAAGLAASGAAVHYSRRGEAAKMER